jgi:hypothetical protein
MASVLILHSGISDTRATSNSAQRLDSFTFGFAYRLLPRSVAVRTGLPAFLTPGSEFSRRDALAAPSLAFRMQTVRLGVVQPVGEVVAVFTRSSWLSGLTR